MSRDFGAELARRLGAIRVPVISPEALRRLAEGEFTGESPGGAVRATVLGTGELIDLQVSVLALRGEARARAGAEVAAAVNAALDAVEAARRDLLPSSGADPVAAIEAMTDELGQRMDRLLGSLVDLERRLPPPPGR